MAEFTMEDTELAREFGYDNDDGEVNDEDSDQVINNIRIVVNLIFADEN